MDDAKQRIVTALLQKGNLSQMPHEDLYRMRMQAGANQEAQNLLGPIEHQAFAREWVKDNPFLAVPSLMFATPAYTAAKAVGILPTDETTSKPSWSEIGAGYKGLGEGLVSAIRKVVK
jgi:hypothetical protein